MEKGDSLRIILRRREMNSALGPTGLFRKDLEKCGRTLFRAVLLWLMLTFLPVSLARAYVPSLGWATEAGGSDFDSANAIAVDTNGNSYVTGYFQSSTARFGTNTLTNSSTTGVYKDIFITKLSLAGNVAWAKSAGGDLSDDAAEGIGVDAAGNCYVTGSFYYIATFGNISITNFGAGYAVFLAKYDTTGTLVWVRQSVGRFDGRGEAIAVAANGNSYITGEFTGSIAFGGIKVTNAGNYDLFVARYDTFGNPVWATGAGGVLDDQGRGIAVDASGNCYVTGACMSTNAIFGSLALTNSGGADVFVAKYSSTGAAIWVRHGGGPSDSYGNGIAVDAAGNSFVTGGFNSLVQFGPTALINNGSGGDIFVVKYDSAGNLLWAKQAGGNNDDQGLGIAVDAAGYGYAAGYFTGAALFAATGLTSLGVSDAFVTKYDPAGNLLWVKQVGGINGVRGLGIGADSSGNGFLTGYSAATNLGGITVTNRGAADAFVVRVDAARLAIAPFATGQVQLSWPVLPAGFHLETNGNIRLTNGWSAVTNIPVLGGDLYLVNLATNKASNFFR
ncbi:MAG: hypothetical protein JWR69_1782, partial [Pedosphaera sp.]|nr:hypothetical protein [Pedosphaera sp.]